MLAIWATGLLLISSCNNEIPEGFVRGGGDELIEATTDFTMAEFLAEMNGTEWVESATYERDGDNIGKDDIYKDMDGAYGMQYRFADEELHAYCNCHAMIPRGVPENGEQWAVFDDQNNNNSYKCTYYHYNMPYIVEDKDNVISFSDKDKWCIVGYNKDNIIVDFSENGRDLRMILKAHTLPTCLKDTKAYDDFFYLDLIEYFEKYDSEFVEAAKQAYAEKDEYKRFMIKREYFAKWGKEF
ncbi:MAG: hypothetical protein R3Y22_01905 [Bacteroidales bacterium]